MASFNRVVLIGNLTRDPELRYISTGSAVSDIGLAVNDRRKDQNGNWVDEVSFIDVTLWGRNAEVASEYTKKGSQVLIEGRLKLDTWETEGQKRSKLRVIAERLLLLGSRSGGAEGAGGSSRSAGYNAGGNFGGGNAPSRYDEMPSEMPSSGDDIPF